MDERLCEHRFFRLAAFLFWLTPSFPVACPHVSCVIATGDPSNSSVYRAFTNFFCSVTKLFAAPVRYTYNEPTEWKNRVDEKGLSRVSARRKPREPIFDFAASRFPFLRAFAVVCPSEVPAILRGSSARSFAEKEIYV